MKDGAGTQRREREQRALYRRLAADDRETRQASAAGWSEVQGFIGILPVASLLAGSTHFFLSFRRQVQAAVAECLRSWFILSDLVSLRGSI